jgi:hypothetical protein
MAENARVSQAVIEVLEQGHTSQVSQALVEVLEQANRVAISQAMLEVLEQGTPAGATTTTGRFFAFF